MQARARRFSASVTDRLMTENMPILTDCRRPLTFVRNRHAAPPPGSATTCLEGNEHGNEKEEQTGLGGRASESGGDRSSRHGWKQNVLLAAGADYARVPAGSGR